MTERQGAAFAVDGLRITPIDDVRTWRMGRAAFTSKRCVALLVDAGNGETRFDLPGFRA